VRKTLVLTLTFCAALALVFGATLVAGAQAAPQAQVKPAEQTYKDIKVMQGVPSDQVLPSMRLFNRSLNVSCEHCHVADHEEQDTPMKDTARKMITMVININKASFDGRTQVTCYTCHRGATNPVGLAILAGPNDKIYSEAYEEPKEVPEGLPAADQIVAKYVEALGGEQAVRKVTSRHITIVADLPSGPREEPRTVGLIEQYQKAPNLTATFTQLPNGTASTGFNGTDAWNQTVQGRVAKLTGTDLARAHRDADFYNSLNLKQTYTRLAVRGVERVGEHNAYLVIATPQGDSAERLYFDTQTGLLLRRITVVPTPVGNSPTQIDYDDYRADEKDGTKFPYLMRITAVTQRRTFHVQKVEDNATVDTSKFVMPESKAPPAPAAR